MSAGCLRLQEASGDNQGDGSSTTTDGGDSSDDSSSMAGEVELSVGGSFEVSTSHAWFDGVNVYVSGGSDVAALNPDGIRWQNEIDEITGGRAFASKSGTAVFGFNPSDHSAPNAAAHFRAYNSADGADSWQYKAPEDEIHNYPRGAAITEGVAAVGSNRYGSEFEPDPLVTGIDVESGEVQWETYLGSTGAQYLSGMWTYDGLICVGVAFNGVALLDPSTGNVESELSALRTLTTGGTVGGEQFFAAADSELTAYELADGSSNWTGSIEGRSYIEPMVDSTLVVVGTGTGNVYAFDRTTGELGWDGSVDGQVNAITASTDRVWVATNSGGLTGFDRAEGSVVHRSTRDIEAMVYADDRLLFGADEAHMATID
jgi:outer membrane protein assembly factor BamB